MRLFHCEKINFLKVNWPSQSNTKFGIRQKSESANSFTHRRTGRGAGSCRAPPSNFEQLRFFGQQEKFGKSQLLKKLPCFLFRGDRYFLF